jgi:hypothetical protein
VQLAIATAIVATLLFLPAGALLALALRLAIDMPLHTFVTFGGVFSAPAGVLAWWALALLPSLLYAALVSR